MSNVFVQDQQRLLDAKIQQEARALRAECGSCHVCRDVRAMLSGKFGPVTRVTLATARSELPGCYCA